MPRPGRGVTKDGTAKMRAGLAVTFGPAGCGPCCGTGPRACHCTPYTILRRCGAPPFESLCCECKPEFDFVITGRYWFRRSVVGHVEGYYYDLFGNRQDWSCDQPGFLDTWNVAFTIYTRARCVEGGVTFDVTGSRWERTDIRSHGVPFPNETLLDEAAVNAVVGMFDLGIGMPAWITLVGCGVVANPLYFNSPGGIIDDHDDDWCSGGWSDSYQYHDEPHTGIGCINGGDIIGFDSYSWSGQTGCEQGSISDSGEGFAQDTVNESFPSYGRVGTQTERVSFQGAASWSRDNRWACDTDPCQGQNPPHGACCLNIQGWSFFDPCMVTTPIDCSRRHGTYQGDNTTCSASNCPKTGACCLPGGGCVQATQSYCSLNLHGRWLGAGVRCTEGGCDIQGACCLPDHSCIFTNQPHCSALAGVWIGQDVPCSTGLCGGAQGACCLLDGSCTTVTGAECVARGGVYRGDGSQCASANCEPRGACCIDSGAFGCWDGDTEDQCQARGQGGFHSIVWYPGQTCQSAGCVPPSPGQPGLEDLL